MRNDELNSAFIIPHSSFPLIRLIQQLDDRLPGCAFSKEAPEQIFLQVREYRVHGLEMLLWLVLWAQQQHDAVDRLVIERGEINPRRRSSHCRRHLGDLWMLGMRDGHTLAKAGGAVLL